METGNGQADFKNEVKQWLKIHRLDYRWMADRCGVSEITVRNWMSQKNIPPLKQQLIERLMVQLPAPQSSGIQTHSISGVSVDAALTLSVKLAPDLYKKLSERAMREGMTPEELVARTISELVHDAEGAALRSAIKMREVILPPLST